jgi:hypothetical protein
MVHPVERSQRQVRRSRDAGCRVGWASWGAGRFSAQSYPTETEAEMSKLGRRLIASARRTRLRLEGGAMRSLEQELAELPPEQRAKVLARGAELIAEERHRVVARKVTKRRRNALRELAKR